MEERGEERLFANEELFRSLLENSPDVITRFDKDLRHLYINPAVELATGIAPTEFIGKTDEELGIPEHLCKYWAEALRKVFESGIPNMTMEFDFETPSGQKSYQAYLVPEFANDGSVKTVLAVSREVTDRRKAELGLEEALAHIEEQVRLKTAELQWVNQSLKSEIAEREQAEQALRRSEEILKAIINGSPVPQFVIDGSHKVTHWNKAMEELTGGGSKEMIGTDRHLGLAYNEERTCLADLVMEDKTEEIFRAYPGKSSRSGLIRGAYEVTDLVSIPGKEEKWLHWTAAQIRDQKGSVIGAVETIEDVTELKRTIEALKKREQDLENKSVNLAEAYTALKVLLQHKEEDKETLEKMFLANVRELVLPYVDKLECTRPSDAQKAYISIVKSNLNDIISPFLQKMSVIDYRLTPAEIQVATLIKEGKSTKEIAQVLNIGMGTVDTHRKSIRHKLGLSKNKVNLQSYLRSLK